MNNPIKFVDPTGMFTELFNENGAKIGEDENGIDGNVSIVSKEDGRGIKKRLKKAGKGALVTQEEIQSGVQTTKEVLKEALDVLSRTEANGGLREEASLVKPEGEIIRGETGPEPKVVKVGGINIMTAETKIPEFQDGIRRSSLTLIHSHPTELFEQDGEGFPQSASIPSKIDIGAFKGFGTNMIVGPIGIATGIIRGDNGKLSTTPSRSNGVVIYQKGKSPMEVREKAVQKIIR